MKRALFRLMVVLSTLLLLASIVEWVRSYSQTDVLYWRWMRLADQNYHQETFLSFDSLRGGFTFGIRRTHATDAVSEIGLATRQGWSGNGIEWLRYSGPVWAIEANNLWYHGTTEPATYLHKPKDPAYLGFQFSAAHQMFKGAVLQVGTVSVPYWATATFFALTPLWSAITFYKRRRYRKTNRCVKCGYDLRETPNRCPECGTIPTVAAPA